MCGNANDIFFVVVVVVDVDVRLDSVMMDGLVVGTDNHGQTLSFSSC